MPKVTVIVPNYNHAPYLQQRLDSIFNQTYQDFEIILLDDCSTDESLALLSKYAEHPKVTHFVVNKKNSGNTFKQWEKGIELSKGDFIWIAESDDYADKEFLEKVVPHIQQDNTIGLVYCQSWKIDDSGQKRGNWISHTNEYNTTLFNTDFMYDGPNFVNEFLIHKNVIPNASAVVFKRSIYEQSNGMDSAFKYCGDWYLWLKISMLSNVFFISESLNYFRKHENSVIFQALKTYQSDKNYLRNTVIEMRKCFSQWIINGQPNYDSIIKRNNLYINKQNKINELFLNIYNGNLLNSFVSSLKYSFLTMEIKYLFIPLRRILILFWGIMKTIIKKK